MGVNPTNWAGNVVFRSERIRCPSSVAELRDVVGESDSVRAIGTGHSFNEITDTAGVLVSVAGLPPRIDLDTAARTVTVAAGLSYAQVACYLNDRGYALDNLASLPHISVAGAVATGTHGSGDANGSLATAVTGLELVTADGGLAELRRADPDFDGAVVSLGALGVVTAVTLAIRPAFSLRQYVFDELPAAVLYDHFDEVAGAAYSVSLFTGWRQPSFQVWAKSLHELGPDGPATASGFFGARPAGGQRHPVPGMPAESCTDQGGGPGPWHERLPHFRSELILDGGNELQSEFLVPREHAVAALRALEAIGTVIAPVLQISEIRTVAADDLWLSPAYRRDVMAVHFTWIADFAAVLPVIKRVEEALAPYEPRPHWGKLFTVVPGYERMPDFADLILRHDPAGKFRNEFISGIVGA